MAYTTIDKSTDYFNSVFYTGNGSASTALTTGTFQPDFCWFKNRGTVEGHVLINAVNGASFDVSSSSTRAQTNVPDKVSAFTSTGVTLGGSAETNENNEPLLAWAWKANGSGSSNTNGSINTIKTSASTASGFSVGTWTGNGSASTIGHGLGVAPAVVMVKNTSEVYGWQVYHQAIGATKYIALNDADSEQTSSQSWNNTAPTSTVFTVGASDSNNKNGNVILFYAFSEIQGYSKFSSYKGNGNNDGTYTYLGFKPAFLIVRRVDSGNSWYMYTGKTSTSGGNLTDKYLEANATAAEATTTGEYGFDFLSNGFKATGTGGGTNNGSGTYVYLAFAENPFVTSTAIPTPAK